MTIQWNASWARALAALAMVMGALLFWNQASQTSAWVFPYFSGAINLTWDLAWRIDGRAYADFAQLTYAQQMEHEFVRGQPSDLVPYSILDRGYVYIVWFAQTLLFWLPPIKAVLWLQIGFHVLSVLWVISRLKSPRQQLFFLLAYGLNPVVLHFVTFAYYYYWQVLPALLWVAYESRGGRPLGLRIYAMAIAMLVAFLIRQSTLLVCVCMLAYWGWRERTVHAGLALLALLVFVMFVKNPSQPWHTAYVGLGAYPNAGGLILSDESGFGRYQQLTGVQIDTLLPDGNYYDAKVRGEYYQVLRQELSDYATQHPLELLRNAVLNVPQSFSLGYVVKSSAITYLSAASGALVMAVMAWQGMYLRMIVLAMGVVGFVLYFPPIPAYMFGNYLLLAWALVHVRGPWQRWLPRTSAARHIQHTE